MNIITDDMKQKCQEEQGWDGLLLVNKIML